MKVDEKTAEIMMDKFADKFAYQIDFRYNAFTDQIEYDIHHHQNWKFLGEDMMSEISDFFKRKYNNYYSIDFLKECFKTASSVRFDENTKAVFDRRTIMRKVNEVTHHDVIENKENDKNKASEFIQIYLEMVEEKYEFRYNVISKEIEYKTQNSRIWKVATDLFLLDMKNMLFWETYNYPFEKFKMLFINDTSLRYE